MIKKLKKGFTLAELLIVVAIIAVLTAIAVPLFVSALNDADEKVAAANMRAVRGAAVVLILSDQATYVTEKYKTDGSNHVWYAAAEVSANGELGEITISEKEVTDYPTLGEKTGAVDDGADGGYKVQVKITESHLTAAGG